MIKNRYILGAFAFLLVLFTISLVVLPRMGLESINLGYSYVDRVFEQGKVTKVDITVDEKDLKQVLENPQAEEYIEATVVVDGTKVENVGLRTKGNSSLSSVARMEDSDRYSFKIDFAHFNNEQSLFGLKKLNLNNNYSDSTQMREYLSYQLMEKMGLATPANSYMYVTINGKEWGLYLGVEQVNETFLAKNFADSTGDLYKPDGTGSDLKWISEKIEDYTGLDLKTNKNTSDQTAMIDMLYAIDNGEDIEQHVDVDEMLRYFAANTALVNLDSYQGTMKHNYYLYEQDGIFSIIPWDYNMSFGGFGVGGGRGKENMPTMGQGQEVGENGEIIPNESGQKNQGNSKNEINQQNLKTNPLGGGDKENNKVVAENGSDTIGNDKANRRNPINIGGPDSGELINESSINFSITTPVSGTTLEDRPLLNALLSVDVYREKYEAYLTEITTTFLTEDNIESITTQVSSLILPYVEKDPTKFYTTEEFLAGVTGEKSLPEFAVQRAESINKQLSGELVVEAETDDGMAPPNMEGGDGFPGGMPPDMGNGEMPENMAPPTNENSNVQMDRGLPDFENGDFSGVRPERKAGDNQQMDMPGKQENHQQASKSEGNTIKTVIISSALFLLLIGATIFAFFFKRRR